MSKYFVVSLVKGGILGGGLVADAEKLTYCTNKLTVPDQLRRLELPFARMERAEPGWLLCFPTVTLHLDGNESWRLIVFSRQRLLRLLAEAGVTVG